MMEKLTKELLDEIFRCAWCGGKRHDTYFDGLKCLESKIKRENLRNDNN